MNFKKKLIWPLVLSAILSLFVSTVDFLTCDPKDRQVVLRHLLVMFFSTSTLALLISFVVEFADSKPVQLLRCLSAGDKSVSDLIEHITEIYTEHADRAPYYVKKTADELRRTSAKLEEIRKGFVYEEPEALIPDTKELLGEARMSLDSLSMIDVGEYWAHPERGEAAISYLVDARARRLTLRKVFLLNRADELLTHGPVFHRLLEIGVEIRFVLLASIPQNQRRDFSLYDGDRYLQTVEFDQNGFNREVKRVSIIRNADEIMRSRKVFEELWQRGQEITERAINPQGRKLWNHSPINHFYNKKAAPNLRLDILPPSKRVLDIGCGAGRCLGPFIEMGAEIVALDEDPEAIRLCRENHAGANLRLVEMRFDPSALGNERFDTIIGFNSIYHCRYSEMLELLEGIKRLLAPGGHLLITLKTLKGNEEAWRDPGAWAPNVHEHSYLGCKVPDYNNFHTFCTEDQIEDIIRRFGRLIHKSEIPLEKVGEEIVQLQGYYLIIQKL